MNGASFLFKYSLNNAILTAVLLTAKETIAQPRVCIYVKKYVSCCGFMFTVIILAKRNCNLSSRSS